MSDANHCSQGGWLVSDPIPIPDDPSDYWVRGTGATVGCNRMRCLRCGAWVRSANGLAVADIAGRVLELHAAESWSALAGAEPSAGTRTYACSCAGWVESALHLTDPDNRDSSCDPDLPWRCAGHPVPALPLDVDGLVVRADTDFDKLVARVATGWVPGGVQDHFRVMPGEWLCRLYARLAGLPQAGHLARAMAGKMSGQDEFERGCGLLFYDRFSDAPGHERIVELGERDGGRGMIEPSRVRYGKAFFSFSPLRVLRARLPEGGDLGEVGIRVLDACKRASLTNPTDEDCENITTVADHDGKWLATRAADVVRAHPERLRTVLDLLRLSGQDELLAIGGIALVSAEDVDKAAVAHWLDMQGNLRSPALLVIRQALDRRLGKS